MKACPSCGWSDEAPTADSVQPNRQLAQVGCVAEAGYLVALFQEAGIAADAIPVEAFDAARGAWRVTYAIRVAESQADVAARVLRAEASEDFTAMTEGVFDPGHGGRAADAVNPWRMLAVLAVVAAAGAVIVIDSFAWRPNGARGAGPLARPARGGAESLDRLADVVGASATFRTDPERGEPRRRLRYLPEASVWELSTDADRDGRYESHRRFSASVAP